MALNAHQRGPAVIVVGAPGCGKTSLISRYVDNVFDANCLATVGIDVIFLAEQTGGLKPSLWDASGHQRFRHIVRGYLAGARAALLVYDLTNKDSLTAAGADWLQALREEAPADAVIVLVGAKADCSAAERQVSPEEAAAFAARHGLHATVEASALTGDGVDEAFEEVFDRLRVRAPPAPSAQEEPLILGRPGASAAAPLSTAPGKPGQWTLGACFSAIGHVICRRRGGGGGGGGTWLWQQQQQQSRSGSSTSSRV
ncbi:hypothetical protein BOX15_Mlig007260g5 [Macrostomum lignano]|uniref:Uncharacterized protein n=1 Tax=Macrostomum lignano TaxID=282301 RepID=A0A267FYL8_9PLAT|nr:hypothetical protein BOX15_Mlig007260g5 [Macrostomum lignano]